MWLLLISTVGTVAVVGQQEGCVGGGRLRLTLFSDLVKSLLSFLKWSHCLLIAGKW